MNHPDEKDIFLKIKNSDISAFESFFHKYYGSLCVFAANILGDDDTAEEIVQDFFVKIWEKREQLFIETSVNHYLYRSVKNLCINHINHEKIKQKHAASVLKESELPEPDDQELMMSGLLETIEETISAMPEKRKQIFRLSRYEGLKYHEIAARLNVSVKTVETHMSLAIKTLRDKLKHFRFLFLFF